jgi:anti-sigma-K factor RskA
MASSKPVETEGMYERMSEAGPHTDEDITLIGEYALHLMDAPARAAFEARLRDEPDLRALLCEWDEGLAHLAREFEATTPPARVKAAVEAQLFGDVPKPASRWFSSGTIFKLLGGGALLAAALAFALYFTPAFLRGNLDPTYVAQIEAEDSTLIVEARYDPDLGAIAINRTAGDAVPGRVLELWLIAQGADGPVSLGVLPSEAQARVTVPEALRAAVIGGTLAVSDEPPGGSQTGAPTGAVLAVGAVVGL